MHKGFLKVRYKAADKDDDELRSIGTRSPARRGVGRPPNLDEQAVAFNNDEAAARFYLRRVLARDHRPGVRGLSPADEAEAVPDLEAIGTQSVGLTKTRIVRFRQTHASIPVFGSRLNVEIDHERELVDIVGNVAEDLEGVAAIPALSPQEALARIGELTGHPEALEAVAPPRLNFFRDDKSDSWHLVYVCQKVPAAPPGFIEAATDRPSHGHGLGRSPRLRRPLLDYIVDAHYGDILLYYSATPLLAIPSKCRGIDELDREQQFWGRKVAEEGFEMYDPRRMIKTYDLELKDIDEHPLPEDPVRSQGNDFGAEKRAAVSAHVNATIVDNFLRSVLMRDGIDDKRMCLESVVNCTSARDGEPPVWHNATWWNKRMWYGQYEEQQRLTSYSRYLDVIAHELMHGVTEYSAGLIYYKQSGALNESFSDILGLIVANWAERGEDSDVGGWNWEIGSGLGSNGLPLRDLSDPKRTKDPAHMDDYLETEKDSGGVHTNSNIHNKAAYFVLTATDADGNRVFTSREVAILYYLCLLRLTPQATFSDALEGLVDVATTYFAGEADLDERVQYLREAYGKVGVE